MPFDPAQPANNSPLSSQVMRDQLTSLKALIDALLTITDAQVDGVSTLNPGDPASASIAVSGSTLHFTFGIPRGNDGAAGQNGSDGGPGPIGPQGPPFATAVVDAVNTLSAGQPAAVSVSFDGTNVHFTFDIPQGFDGATGPQGLPGEVTNADLQAAVTQVTNDSSANTNGVDVISAPMADADDELLRSKLNELITALRR